MAEVFAVVGAVASVTQLLANCKKIADFFSKVIREVGGDESVKTLKADIDSLSTELNLVDRKCNQAQQPSSPFRIDQYILDIFESEKLGCRRTLRELEKLLLEVSGGSLNPSSFERFRHGILRSLRSPEVEELRKRVTKHQQQLHFYVTLISECKLDEVLRRIPSNNSVSPTASLVDVPIQPPSPGASRTIVAPQIPSLSTDTATRRHSLQQTHSVPEPTPTTRTFVDGLRPPGLVHRDRLFTKRLFRAHCVANAISRSGQFVGWFCDDKYEIYELAASETYLACTGKLKKGKYWYGRNKPERKHVDGQMTPGISCAALSDEYIAVGCYGTLLIFTVQGDSPGRWLSSAKFNDVHIEKLVFSPKGDELLAVLKAKDQNGQNSCHKAIVYSSSDFVDDCQQSDEKVKSLRSIEVAEWENSVCEVADAAFSSEGRKIVIGTRHDNRGKSRIMLLKKYPEEGWQKYGDSISLLVRERQDSSAGMNGISFFERNKDLVCGLETSFKKASDWHRIKATAGNPTLRPRETTVASDHIRSKILAITVSPLDYNAVALASLGDTSREFLLEFKQQCHEPLSSVVLNFTRTSFQCKLVKPITFSFSDCGTRLILLTGEGVLEVHKLEIKN